VKLNAITNVLLTFISNSLPPWLPLVGFFSLSKV